MNRNRLKKLALAALAALAAFACQVSPSFAQNPQPDREETLKWLKTYFNDFTVTFVNYDPQRKFLETIATDKNGQTTRWGYELCMLGRPSREYATRLPEKPGYTKYYWAIHHAFPDGIVYKNGQKIEEPGARFYLKEMVLMMEFIVPQHAEARWVYYTEEAKARVDDLYKNELGRFVKALENLIILECGKIEASPFEK